MIEIEVKINIKGVEQTIKIEEPLGLHQEQYLEAITKLSEDPKNAVEFLRTKDKIIVELTEYELEQVRLLPLLEKNKIFDKIERRFIMFKGSKTEKSAKN